MSRPQRRAPNRTTEIVTDPEEIAASEERSRHYRKTAAGRIGCEQVIDAPLPILAQFIAELAPEDRQVFLSELAARLPADSLASLAAALRARLDSPAA